MMKRRSFFAVLLALPFVPAMLRAKEEAKPLTFHPDAFKLEMPAWEPGFQGFGFGWYLDHLGMARCVEHGCLVEEDGWPVTVESRLSVEIDNINAVTWKIDGHLVRKTIPPMHERGEVFFNNDIPYLRYHEE